MTKRSRNTMLFENAPGGPAVVPQDYTVDLTEETSDGKQPSFRILTAKGARGYPIFRKPGPPPAPGDRHLLFDEIVQNGLPNEPDLHVIRPLMFQARHFVLDEAASAFISKLAADTDLLDELREFALPPFDKLAITHLYAPGHEHFPKATFDNVNDGFQSLTLWDNGRWKLFVAKRDGSSIAAIPGWTRNFPNGVVENSLGGGTWELKDRDRTLGSLRLHRTIIDAFFLLMAQPKIYQLQFSEARRSLRKGHPVKFFARTEIKIDLADPVIFRRAFSTGSRPSPRRHEVRRHFIHLGGDRACTHEWQPIESADRKHRWLCGCGRRRIERGPFGRGDANKGFVHQSYAITAGERAR